MKTLSPALALDCGWCAIDPGPRQGGARSGGYSENPGEFLLRVWLKQAFPLYQIEKLRVRPGYIGKFGARRVSLPLHHHERAARGHGVIKDDW